MQAGYAQGFSEAGRWLGTRYTHAFERLCLQSLTALAKWNESAKMVLRSTSVPRERPN